VVQVSPAPADGVTADVAVGAGISAVLQPSSSSSSSAANEKGRLIQQQLVLVLHAHKCQRREQQLQQQQLNNGVGPSAVQAPPPCTLPNCANMKNVLKHMTICKEGKNCTGNGPVSSKIKHAIKHKTSPARLAQLLQPSLAFCFSLQPMTASRPVLDGTLSLAAS